MASNSLGRNYSIIPYSPHWARQFKGESKVISGIFANDLVAIEHVGSTSVPDMAGKPLIDILVAVKDIAQVEARIEAMEKAGFTAYGDYLQKKSYLFTREIAGEKLVHVHVFEQGHPHIQEMLSIRDYLREHPEEAKAYSKLKYELKRRYPNDYGAYRREKDAYMEELKQRATA